MKKAILCALILIISGTAMAQDTIAHKNINIKRVTKAPNIDGVLDDVAWQNTNIATNFVMFRPESGTPEPDNLKTEVRIVYDDEAIYFGAFMHDDKPDEIPMEFQTRDNFGNADFFGVILNPANDGINQTEFFVMSTGNQNDAKVDGDGREDFSWNAVWTSSTKVVDNGWIVEMKIPYSALRFSNEKIQTWGLNFHRHHRKNRHQYTWNFIDRQKGNIAQYDGTITGIENIDPPVRLSFNPFVFAGANSFDGEDEFDWSAGLDVKYGISENFTLDATLVPAFGQVAYDDVTLNLGPFEQRFSEQRAFFNEGTDLFRKGGIFESRRIGSRPTGEATLADNESIEEYPNNVDVLNIVKVSGRTQKGLGVGFLNAVTKKTEVDIKKTETINGVDQISYRKEVVEPLSNYNVLVVDQQFNKNSSVSLINTNVIRSGSDFRDANVTAFLFDLNTKKNEYGVEGGIAMSNVYHGQGENPVSGLEGGIELGKISGKRQYDIGLDFVTQKYNKNDLGFQRGNNELNFSGSYSYRIFEPKGKLNNMYAGVWANVNYLMDLDENTASYHEKSNLYRGNRFGGNLNFFTKKLLAFGANFNTSIGTRYDYYEPRVVGRFFKVKPNTGIAFWISTNYNNSFAVDASIYNSVQFNDDAKFTSFRFSPRYRINDKITLIYTTRFSFGNNAEGYVTQNNDDIIFGTRKTKSTTNTLSTKYNFNTKASLGLAFRHFWSPVEYDNQFYTLENDGNLSVSNYTQLENNDANLDNDINHDINFNTWNIDFSFNWEFAPGSQLIALYRNSIFNQDDQSQLNFGDNLDNLFDQPIRHDLSLKVVYFVDYNNMKGLFKKKNS